MHDINMPVLSDIHIAENQMDETDSKDVTMENLFNKIGNFGRYQVLLLIFAIYAILCWGALTYATIVFLIAEPKWECVNNSTVCNITGSVGPGEQNYDYRCGIPRRDWKFTNEYTSLVTQVSRVTFGFIHRRRKVLICLQLHRMIFDLDSVRFNNVELKKTAPKKSIELKLFSNYKNNF